MHRPPHPRDLPKPHETVLAVLRHMGWPLAFVLVVWAAGGVVLTFALGGDTPWTDGFYWAAMMLTGMGPPSLGSGPENAWLKWFLSFYAMFAGFVFLGGVTYALQPIFHRVLHAFHIPEK
jgi:hypothetical protein